MPPLRHFVVLLQKSDAANVRVYSSEDVRYAHAVFSHIERAHVEDPTSIDVTLLSGPDLASVQETHGSYFRDRTVVMMSHADIQAILSKSRNVESRPQ